MLLFYKLHLVFLFCPTCSFFTVFLYKSDHLPEKIGGMGVLGEGLIEKKEEGEGKQEGGGEKGSR